MYTYICLIFEIFCLSCETESTSLEGQRKSSKCGLELGLADGVVMEGESSGSSELETPKLR